MTHSLVNENWELLERFEENGNPACLVAREKRDFDSRLTVWKLVKIDGKWRSLAQWISKGQWRTFPEKNGVLLSTSVLDLTLRHFAESG